MISQRRQTSRIHGFRFIHSFYASVSILNILKGSLQPKLKEPMFGPLMHAVKLLQAEYVIYDQCTGTVFKEKIDQKLTAVISRAIFACPGRAGPVFSLDPINLF